MYSNILILHIQNWDSEINGLGSIRIVEVTRVAEVPHFDTLHTIRILSTVHCSFDHLPTIFVLIYVIPRIKNIYFE